MDLDKNMIKLCILYPAMYLLDYDFLFSFKILVLYNTHENLPVNTTYFDIKTIITKGFPKLKKVPLHVITSYKLWNLF